MCVPGTPYGRQPVIIQTTITSAANRENNKGGRWINANCLLTASIKQIGQRAMAGSQPAAVYRAAIVGYTDCPSAGYNRDGQAGEVLPAYEEDRRGINTFQYRIIWPDSGEHLQQLDAGVSFGLWTRITWIELYDRRAINN